MTHAHDTALAAAKAAYIAKVDSAAVTFTDAMEAAISAHYATLMSDPAVVEQCLKAFWAEKNIRTANDEVESTAECLNAALSELRQIVGAI